MPTSPKANYFLPSPNLKSIVHHYEWHNSNLINQLGQVTILPSFSVGILFYFNKFNKTGLGRTAIIPPTSTPTIGYQFNQFDTLRVIFLPGKMTQLFGKKMSIFHNSTLDASRALDTGIKYLYQAMQETHSVMDKIQQIERYILNKLQNKTIRPTLFSSIEMKIPQIEEQHRYKVQSLASKLGLSRQHFNLVCKDEVGFSAKKALSILRFNKTLTHLHTNAKVSLAQTAIEFGYNDQAHFSNEFKKMTTTSPKQYLRSIGNKFLYGNLADFSHTGLLIG